MLFFDAFMRARSPEIGCNRANSPLMKFMPLQLALFLFAFLAASFLASHAATAATPVLVIRGAGETDVFRAGVTLFTNRSFTVSAGFPAELDGLNFHRGSIDGIAFRVERGGRLIVLTPHEIPGSSSQLRPLEELGFTRQSSRTFQLFPHEYNKVWTYAKDVLPGERYYFGKYVILLGFASSTPWPETVWTENRGELLYNNIRLPEEWPPRNISTTDTRPMPVPYLDHRPDVVPVDIGRQLFVDDFLIEQTTLDRVFHHPKKHPANPVLKPETELELNARRVAPVFHGEPGAPAATPKSGGVWWDADAGHFKMWYEAGWLNTIALATSRDGITWDRPEFDIRPGTNQVLPVDLTPDSWTVVRNWDATDPAEKYTLFIAAPGADHHATSLTSPDGIHWNNRTKAGICGDRSTHFYNPFRKKWVYSIRTGFANRGRARQYYETSDFMKGAAWTNAERIPWLMTDELDPTDYLTGDRPQLYNFDAVAYESLMLGMFEIHQGPDNATCNRVGLPKITELQFAYSRDGFHWQRPDRRIAIPAERKDVWDRGYVQSIGNVCVIQGDELWFYYSAYQGNPATAGKEWMQDGGMYSHGATGVAVLRRDGFASMDAGAAPGTLTTRPVTFSGRRLFVNAAVAAGSVRAEIRDLSGRPIAPFTLENSIPFGGDETLTALGWKHGADLSSLAGRPVRIHFEVTNGALYSFWISRDDTGRSDGYIAGGGPGYDGPTDTVGRPALRQATRLPSN
jgi:hypothetical protein